MKLETLKKLIRDIQFDESIDYGDDPDKVRDFIINKVIELLDLYESDNEMSNPIIYPRYPIYPVGDEDLVPYSETCGCNPKNGGSGVCGCVMGNQLVPRKYQPRQN